MSLKRYLVIVLALFVYTGPAMASTPDDVERVLARVAALSAAGQPQEAMGELLAALKAQPNQIPLHMAYIELMIQGGRRADVISVYKGLKERSPTDPTALFLYGQTLAEPAPRIALYKEALAARAGYPWALLGLASVSLSQNKPEEAILYLKQCLGVAPTLEPALEMLATLLALQGKPKEAIPLYETLRKEDRSNTRAALALANIYRSQEDYPAAAAAMVEVSAADPNNVEHLSSLGFLQFRARAYALSVAAWKKAAALAPQDETPRVQLDVTQRVQTGALAHDPVVWWQDAHALEGTNPQQSLRLYGKAVDAAADFEVAWVYLGRLLAAMDKTSEALEALSHAVRLAPDSALTQLAYGQVLLEVGMTRQAEGSLTRAAQLAPGQLSPQISLGLLYMALQDPFKAEEAYRRALSLSPGGMKVPLHVNLAGTLSAQGRSAEAAAELKKAQALAPNNLEVKLALSMVLAEDWRFDESISLLGEILKKDPNSAVAREQLLLVQTRKATVGDKVQRKMRARQILVPDYAQANVLQRELAGGADFARLAWSRSRGPEAQHGGDLGWFAPEDLDPALADALKKVSPGKMTPVVQTSAGFHILLRTY